ncbi:uncharacterized protein V1518DRAFT_370782 [Limtongia smithiae]|uniref:uncharacterized protein n=1 Tax=Limtongia smithiae TaxID=1125753 RepID=UPI0034CFA638
MADFVLFDQHEAPRPSSAHGFSTSSFDNSSLFPSPYGDYQPSPAAPAAIPSSIPKFDRRASYSLPASLASTPTSQSFFNPAMVSSSGGYLSGVNGTSGQQADSLPDMLSPLAMFSNNSYAQAGLPTGVDDLDSLMQLPDDDNDNDTLQSHNSSFNPQEMLTTTSDDPISYQYSQGRRMSEDPADLGPTFKNPKLERTISDVLEDELYSPAMSPVLSVTSDDFLNDFSDVRPATWAKSLPTTRTASPSPYRDMSPFRKSSSFYPGPSPESPVMTHQSVPQHYRMFPSLPTSAGPSMAASQPSLQRVQAASDELRVLSGSNLSSSPQPIGFQSKYNSTQDASPQQQLQNLQLQHLMQQQQSRQRRGRQMFDLDQRSFDRMNAMRNQRQQMALDPAVKTISPKEALLDLSETDILTGNDVVMPTSTPKLFGPTPSSSSNSSSANLPLEEQSDIESGDDSFLDSEYFSTPKSIPRSVGHPTPTGFEDMAVETPTQSSSVSSPVASDYEDASSFAVSPVSDASYRPPGGASFDSRFNVGSSSRIEPDISIEESTCPECSVVFPSLQQLRAHRRIHHSQTPPRKKLPLSAHTGPHRCTYVSPKTGKPCNKIFSRPYDLIRHQETIHSAERRTYKCDLCDDDTKTFSRPDALARHIRVKHEKGGK